MPYEMEVNFREQYVEAISEGEKSFQTAKRLWGEITRLCQEHQCFRVLGIADSAKQMSVMDSMDHQKLFKTLNITPKYIIAWVELNQDEFEKLEVLETIMINRGFVAKAFKNVDAAKAWLFEQ